MHSSRMHTIRSSSRLSWGGGLPQCMLEYQPPGSRHPPGAEPPRTRHTPRSRHPLGTDTPGSRHPPGTRHPSWTRHHPLGADTSPPPRTRHPPRDQAPPPCGQTDACKNITFSCGWYNDF